MQILRNVLMYVHDYYQQMSSDPIIVEQFLGVILGKQ